MTRVPLTKLPIPKELMEQRKFYVLLKNLCDYDKGLVEVEALVQIGADNLPPHAELIDQFRSFLPEKAKPMLGKLLRS